MLHVQWNDSAYSSEAAKNKYRDISKRYLPNAIIDPPTMQQPQSPNTQKGMMDLAHCTRRNELGGDDPTICAIYPECRLS